MLHLCPKCPAYVCLLESALFLPSFITACIASETFSVLSLKIGDFFMPSLSCQIYLLPPLKSECKESCKCRCILPVCWGYRADSGEQGMFQHEAFRLWFFSGKPLILTAASSAVLLVCLLQLGWNSDCAGSQALWARLPVQPGSEDVPWCQPSVDCLHRALAL